MARERDVQGQMAPARNAPPATPGPRRRRWGRAGRGPGAPHRVALLLVMAGALLLAGCAGHRPAPGQAATAGRPGNEDALSGRLLVSAAASLQDALQEAAARFTARHPGVAVDFNFGSSGALARQIEAGAPADLFIAAGPQPVGDLVARGLVDRADVRTLCRNRLVLVVPADGPSPVGGWADLDAAAVRRVAVGDPAHVPAGQYGRQVLRHLGLWEAVRPKLVLESDVRAVLRHVAAGAVEAGIVYRTDALSSPAVRVVAEAPPGSHDPIVYPLVVLKTTPHRQAADALAAFLTGPEGQEVLARHGFLPGN